MHCTTPGGAIYMGVSLGLYVPNLHKHVAMLTDMYQAISVYLGNLSDPDYTSDNTNQYLLNASYHIKNSNGYYCTKFYLKIWPSQI